MKVRYSKFVVSIYKLSLKAVMKAKNVKMVSFVRVIWVGRRARRRARTFGGYLKCSNSSCGVPSEEREKRGVKDSAKEEEKSRREEVVVINLLLLHDTLFDLSGNWQHESSFPAEDTVRDEDITKLGLINNQSIPHNTNNNDITCI